MKLNCERLEDRHNPAPTFNWTYNETLFGEYAAYGAGNGGGPRAQVFLHGQPVLDAFLFEPTFRGGVSVGMADFDKDGDPDLLAGAGYGGAPRVKVFVNNNNQFGQVADYFIGNPANRWGVYVDRFSNHQEGYVDQVRNDANDIAATRHLTLKAESYPTLPQAETLFVNLNLLSVPISQQYLLASRGAHVYVHNKTSVNQLPGAGLEHLSGLTPDGGDGNRTWEQVDTAAFGYFAAIGPRGTPNTLHEVGHLIQFVVLGEYDPQWLNICAQVAEPTLYEHGSTSEAFAEAYFRELTGQYNHPLVKNYLRTKLPW